MSAPVTSATSNFPSGCPTVCVVICTVDRNEQLMSLLSSLRDAAVHSGPTVRVGVAILDDHPDAVAKAVVGDVQTWFDDGVQYVHTGSRNLATARNTAIATGIASAEYVGFVDDDCVVQADWFDRHLALHRRFGCDVTTGPFRYVVPSTAPKWLNVEGMLANVTLYDDGCVPDYGSTANAVWRSAWLIENPGVRFRTSLGRAGGEDMVFYGDAKAAGVHHRYALHSLVLEELTPARSTYRYQLRQHYWLGNTEAVTNLRLGHAARSRLVVRGIRRAAEGVGGAMIRTARRRDAHWRLASVKLGEGAGLVIGALGVTLHHH